MRRRSCASPGTGKSSTGVLESWPPATRCSTRTACPLRAKLTISLKEYRPVAVQVSETRKRSSDVDKTWTVAAGDRLDRIAFAVYRDAGLWRVLAEANGIDDPRTLEPGRLLERPQLT